MKNSCAKLIKEGNGCREALEGEAKIKSRAGGCLRVYCNTVCQWILNVRYTRRDACKCMCAWLCSCVFDPSLEEYNIPASPKEQHIFPLSSNLRHSEGVRSFAARTLRDTESNQSIPLLLSCQVLHTIISAVLLHILCLS